MPIMYEAMRTQFALVSEEITVREVIEMLTALPLALRNGWYVVVQLSVPGQRVVPGLTGGYQAVAAMPPGYAVVSPLEDLSPAGETHGEALLDMALHDVPGLLLPAWTVERDVMGTGRASRDWVPLSPRQRLVVLESGQVVGLLVDIQRAGSFGGFMTTLFGRERQPYGVTKDRITYRCPVDGESYDFSEVIDLATNRLVCPRGHVIQE
jgi:hypothetical protein